MIHYCDRRVLSLAQASALALLLAAGHSAANPTAPTITRGQATFATQGNTLTVTNTPGAIINWQGFSIPSQDITRFLQQSASSAVLNRVTGATPSTILGQLQSNGQVFLINPNGTIFGANAQINTTSLIASSLQIPDNSFLVNKFNFSNNNMFTSSGSLNLGNTSNLGGAVTDSGTSASTASAGAPVSVAATTATASAASATPSAASATPGKETQSGNSSTTHDPTAQVILEKREPVY